MTPYIDDPDFTLHVGDSLDVLRQMPDESVHCVVTSPPYWGLRDYGTGAWDGGDAECQHEGDERWYTEKTDAGSSSEAFSEAGEANAARLKKGRWREKGVCVKCGARRVDKQLGLEPTPDEYVSNMVAVFREVRRVLRRDGTCWLNIGDSYTSIGRTGRKESPGVGAKQEMNRVEREVVWAQRDEGDPLAHFRWSLPGGQKPKDLVGIPWRLAFALQADGWYLRADIIWAKPNPMPESVTDRPTKAHEFVFLLTRSPKYFFDQEAVREPHSPDGRIKTVHDHQVNGSHENYANMGTTQERWPNGGRNIRSVWEIATQPYAGAHFATFPEALVERCVKAGSPEDGTILDPFMGSGTTALVARRLGRKSIGIELNEEYARLAARRLQQLSLLTS